MGPTLSNAGPNKALKADKPQTFAAYGQARCPGTADSCMHASGSALVDVTIIEMQSGVVVISPRLPHRDGLRTIVPISGIRVSISSNTQCDSNLRRGFPHPNLRGFW